MYYLYALHTSPLFHAHHSLALISLLTKLTSLSLSYLSLLFRSAQKPWLPTASPTPTPCLEKDQERCFATSTLSTSIKKRLKSTISCSNMYVYIELVLLVLFLRKPTLLDPQIDSSDTLILPDGEVQNRDGGDVAATDESDFYLDWK